MLENDKMTKNDFQKLSLNFRRVASSLLSSSHSDYHRQLKKFLYFIDSDSTIKEFIDSNMTGEYDFSEVNENPYELFFQLPISDSDEISYVYQLLNYISQNETSLTYLTFRYGSRGQNNKLSSFNNEVIKPLIDNINTYLVELKIDKGFQNNYGVTNQYTFKKDFRGQINQATNNSTITAHQTYKESDIEDIKDYSNDFLSALTESQEVASEEKLALVELLEVTIQNLEREEPKKTLIKIAMEKIKGVTDTIDTATTLHVIGTTLYAALANLQ